VRARRCDANAPNTAEPLPDINAISAPALRRHSLRRPMSGRSGRTALSRSFAGSETVYRKGASLLLARILVNRSRPYAAAVETPRCGTATTNHGGTRPR
jgi:hypothetical protein